jgi:hypothetical protein
MGLSFGGSSSQNQSSGQQSQQNVYAPGQSGVQGALGSDLMTALGAASSGTLTPGVTAGETQADDQINKTAAGTTSRVNQLLAARGFGPSGQTGQTTLQGELARESGIGAETGIAQQQQQNLNSTNLLAALNYAFTSLGSNLTGRSMGSGSGSNWGANASAAFGFG